MKHSINASGYTPVEPLPYFVGKMGDDGMLVPGVIRKTVVFIGDGAGDQFAPLATGFVVSVITEQHRFLHIVTAEHVIAGMQTRKPNPVEIPYIRVNTVNGDVETFPAPYGDWSYHPSGTGKDEVAVLPCAIDRGHIVYAHIPIDSFATPLEIEDKNIGTGDELFIAGLFRSHFGKGRNIPIIRTGNIAAMPEEPVKTRYCGYIDAYLIEAHSIGGLSGSPVWVHMPPLRVIKGEVTAHEGSQFYLLGLMHGHFDISDLKRDVVTDSDTGRGINTGVGVVVPAVKIKETIMQEELIQRRKSIVKNLQEGGATSDLNVRAIPSPPTTDENPQHREDFNSLLDAATGGNKPDSTNGSGD